LLQSWGHSTYPATPEPSLAAFFLSWAESNDAPQEPHNLMAAIDQFEELFTLKREERHGILRDLGTALHDVPELRLLLAISDDCLDDFKLHESSFGVPLIYFELKDLSPEATLEAITRPLADSGLAFDTGVAEELVDQLHEVSNSKAATSATDTNYSLVRPLFLQLVCYQLWSRHTDDLISFDMLREAGNLDEALLHFYDDVIAEVSLNTGEAEKRLRGWIENKFISRDGSPRTARRGTALMGGMPNEVAETFTDRHILKIERRLRTTWYELEHHRLVAAIVRANREWRAGWGENSLPSNTNADPVTYAVSAQAALNEGDVATARRLAALAASWHRNSGDERRLAHALMLQGSIAYAQGDLSSAESKFQAALARFTLLQDRNRTAEALSALGEIRGRMGDYRTAAEFQQLAIDYLPTDVDALIGLGYAQWYEGFPADADATFTQALAWKPDSARALVGRGQVRAEMQEYEVALSDLSRALAAGLPAKDEIDAMTARALVLTGLGRAAEGERELNDARARDPRRARTLFRAARVAAMKGQAELALKELERGLAARPPVSSGEEANARKLVTRVGRKLS
jgi:tetratricopeptide (TPR) repeat protein